MNRIATSLVSLAILASAAPAQGPATSAAIRDFDAYTAKAARDWGVPGLAIAIVRNDSVLLARGYGVRALGQPGSVDAHTLFGIMSTTKAMTAAALAMLVDDGKVSWNDPVAKWLPEVQFPDPFLARELTVRDLLTHNTGLGNADLLWTRGDMELPEILGRIRYLRPSYSLRAGFVYHNVMYGAAGEVIARASGMSWEEFVRTRIFVPLGMTRTYPTYRAAAAARDPNISRAHYRIGDSVRVIDEDLVDAVPAAGSVWSTASDMARWARFLLDSARVDGKRLISARNFAELFRPHVVVPPGGFYPTAQVTRPRWTTYGLGWYQQDYNGRYLAFHTGSLDGRTAIIGLVPDARMAVIVFGNLDHAEVRHALMLRAADVFAGTNGAPLRDWSTELAALYGGQRRRADSLRTVNESRRIAGTRPTLPLSAYAGTYTSPAWGSLVVTERAGKLHLQAGVGSQNAGPLEHWHYDTFRVTYGDGRGGPSLVQFVLGTDGSVARLLVGGSEDYSFTKAPPQRR